MYAATVYDIEPIKMSKIQIHNGGTYFIACKCDLFVVVEMNRNTPGKINAIAEMAMMTAPRMLKWVDAISERCHTYPPSTAPIAPVAMSAHDISIYIPRG